MKTISKICISTVIILIIFLGCSKEDNSELANEIVENLVIGNSQFIEGSIPLPDGIEFDELEGPSDVEIINKTGANPLSFFADEPISLLLVEFEGVEGYFQIVYNSDGDFAFARKGEENAVFERIANIALIMDKNNLPKFVDLKARVIGVVGYKPRNQPPTREELQGFFNENTLRMLRYIGLWRFMPPVFACGTSTVRDIDGNVYKTVQIGSQCWMKENLVVSKFRNGEVIPAGFREGEIPVTSTLLPYRERGGAPIRRKGFFYNYFAATDNRKICPLGWHIPSKTEFEALITELGGTAVAGDKLKSNESGDFSWYPTPLSARSRYNSSQFSAFDAGWKGIYDSGGGGALFWSTSLDGCPVHEANILVIVNSESTAKLEPMFQYNFMPCRCIKD